MKTILTDKTGKKVDFRINNARYYCELENILLSLYMTKIKIFLGTKALLGADLNCIPRNFRRKYSKHETFAIIFLYSTNLS